MKRFVVLTSFLSALVSCAVNVPTPEADNGACEYAKYFEISHQGTPSVITVSPYDGRRDTLAISKSMDNIICMSSSNVAALVEIGADSVITAVSGLKYISSSSVRDVPDIGYESSLDYEKIMSLSPDLLVTYTVSGAQPPYLGKLRSLGIPVLVLHDHLENHPLARAEYMRLFGVLTGREAYADSVFAGVRDRYLEKAEAVKDCGNARRKVLLNIPYGDAWYVPGKDNYMARIISDAGGEVLGAEAGTSSSRTISLEQAYLLSQQADIWLNPGHCRTRSELSEVHRLFLRFRPLEKHLPIYNNTLRTTPEGGNDFWESGAVRPDLVLADLVSIMADEPDASFNYFFPLP